MTAPFKRSKNREFDPHSVRAAPASRVSGGHICVSEVRVNDSVIRPSQNGIADCDDEQNQGAKALTNVHPLDDLGHLQSAPPCTPPLPSTGLGAAVREPYPNRRARGSSRANLTAAQAGAIAARRSYGGNRHRRGFWRGCRRFKGMIGLFAPNTNVVVAYVFAQRRRVAGSCARLIAQSQSDELLEQFFVLHARVLRRIGEVLVAGNLWVGIGFQ
jgi:hypothetical protein